MAVAENCTKKYLVIFVEVLPIWLVRDFLDCLLIRYVQQSWLLIPPTHINGKKISI